jgi:NADPH:quinone reductase-like Zn-dependent oxidoreductase
MKAVRFHEHGGPEVLTFEDVPDPRPAAGEAVVRVRACALNRLDIWKRQGMPHVTVPMPHISGSHVAGEVASRRPLILPTASACARVRRGEDVLVLAPAAGWGRRPSRWPGCTARACSQRPGRTPSSNARGLLAHRRRSITIGRMSPRRSSV